MSDLFDNDDLEDKSPEATFNDDFEKNQLSNIVPYGKTKRFELKKHVGAIHTSSRMTLVQHQLNDFLLLNAFDSLLTQEVHAIPIKEIREHLNYNSNNLDFIKSSLEALRTYPIKWNVLDENGNEDWVSSSVIAEARIKNGFCYYAYGPFLRERLASPEVYALLDLRVQQSFTTEHALKLWENCYRFVRVGSTGIISLEKWKEILLSGDPVQSYPEFKDFKRYVLTPAIEQVNTVSNIRIEAHYHKEPVGRKIAAIRFDVSLANQASLDMPGQYQVDEEVMKILVNEFEIAQDKANKVCTGYPKDYIMEKVVNARIQKNNKKIRSIGGYLIRALEMDYKMVTRKKSANPPSSPGKSEAPENNKISAKFNKFKQQKVNDYLEQLAEPAKEKLELEFVRTLDSTNQELFKKRGMKSRIIESNFITYIANNVIGKDSLIVAFAEDAGIA